MRDQFLAALAAAVLILGAPALAQDHALVNEHEWISEARTADGESCCGKDDTYRLTHAEASGLEVGSTIVLQTPYGRREVTINIIHPSEDPDGWPWVTTYGCLFRAPGV